MVCACIWAITFIPEPGMACWLAAALPGASGVLSGPPPGPRVRAQVELCGGLAGARSRGSGMRMGDPPPSPPRILVGWFYGPRQSVGPCARVLAPSGSMEIPLL